MQNRASELVNEIARSTGVSAAKAKREVTLAIDRLVHFAGWTDKYQQVFGSVNPVASSHFNFTTPEPTGVVVVLAPDEPSLLAFVSLLAPVILSGNTAVVIASEKFPLPAATFAEILATSDLPGGVVNILTGKRAELVPHIATHMDVNAIVDGICGRKIKRGAASRGRDESQALRQSRDGRLVRRESGRPLSNSRHGGIQNRVASDWDLICFDLPAFIRKHTLTPLNNLKNKQPTSVVTGAAGFLGSHLTDLLVARGHKVIGIDNFVTGSVDNIAHLGGNPNFKFIQQDVTEFIFLEGPVDYVWHFASPASPIDYLELPIQTLKVGSLGTHKALGLAKEKNARFLIASTSEIYGDPLVHPQPEEYWGNVNTIGPRGCYDEAKRFAEAMTMAYHREHKVETRIVRIFNTYGPRMRINDGRVVPAFISQAIKHKPVTVFGQGTQTRSFCYVSDLIEGIYRLMMSNYDLPVNIGNPTEMTMVQFAEQIIRATNSRSKIAFKPLPQDDPKQRKPDITKAKKLLKWEPKVKLAEGLTDTIAYFRTKV